MLASGAAALAAAEALRDAAAAVDPDSDAAVQAGEELEVLEADARRWLSDSPCRTGTGPTGTEPTLSGPELRTELLATARSCDRALDPPPEPLAKLADERWTDFTEDYVTPWQTLAAVILGVVATGLVLALLLTHALPNGDRWHLDEPARRGVRRFGFALLVGAGSVVPVAVASGRSPSALTGAAPLALALVGVLLLAWGFSRRLAVAVTDDKGAENHVASGHVLALLHEMGSERPQGIQVPRGSDMTALQDAGLTTSPEGKVAAAAYRLLQLLVPRAPWQVRIDVESADVHAVLIRRNGRLVSSAVVAREALRLRAPGAADAQAAGPGAAPVETEATDAPKTPARWICTRCRRR